MTNPNQTNTQIGATKTQLWLEGIKDKISEAGTVDISSQPPTQTTNQLTIPLDGEPNSWQASQQSTSVTQIPIHPLSDQFPTHNMQQIEL